ncbi:hypothetical protein C289_2879 [Anoxybacillus ayderensis]|nr:hypothetical protein C289_2879 [Anoxybacillus ayderensis]
MTFHQVNYGLFARKTARIMKDVHGLSISHHMPADRHGARDVVPTSNILRTDSMERTLDHPNLAKGKISIGQELLSYALLFCPCPYSPFFSFGEC